MFVAGTLQADEELIENVVSVMQGARLGSACAEEDAEIQIGAPVTLEGRGPRPEPRGPE
jgi:hypothetical protein